jgi:hypothetical protein
MNKMVRPAPSARPRKGAPLQRGASTHKTGRFIQLLHSPQSVVLRPEATWSQVFIGKNLNREELTSGFDACFVP